MSCYDAGSRPVFSRGLSMSREVNTSLFNRHTSDCPPGDLRHAPLKEGQEKCVQQHILHCLKLHANLQGDALHKVPLLLEGLLQAHICCLRVSTRHPSQGGHQVPPPLNLTPQQPCLLCLFPDEPPKITDPRHNMKPVPLKKASACGTLWGYWCVYILFCHLAFPTVR